MTSQTTNDNQTHVASDAIPFRPLGLVKNIVEAIGLDITYLYDDLIFIEHNAFLLQMGSEKNEEIGVWFNEESTPADRPQMLLRLQEEGSRCALNVLEKGTYSLVDNSSGEGVDIRFTAAV